MIHLREPAEMKKFCFQMEKLRLYDLFLQDVCYDEKLSKSEELKICEIVMKVLKLLAEISALMEKPTSVSVP